jgi:hypothetical protein
MFSNTQSGNWSDDVRGCLTCMFKHGADPTVAHAFCYLDATMRSPLDAPGGWGDAFGTALALELGAYQ